MVDWDPGGWDVVETASVTEVSVIVVGVVIVIVVVVVVVDSRSTMAVVAVAATVLDGSAAARMVTDSAPIVVSLPEHAAMVSIAATTARQVEGRIRGEPVNR